MNNNSAQIQTECKQKKQTQKNANFGGLKILKADKIKLWYFRTETSVVKS